MNKLKVLFVTIACVVSLNVNATFTNNGDNTISDNISGLDWLALSETRFHSYADAEVVHTGWRYATNNEVEEMFASFFPNYVANYINGSVTDDIATLTSNSIVAPYADMRTDISNFKSLFGLSKPTGQSFGLYRDEDGILRMTGVQNVSVYGLDYSRDNDFLANAIVERYSAYLVRETSVPEASSIFLLAFGIFGLLGSVAAKRNV